MSYRDNGHPEHSRQDDEHWDLLAGEYVIGTLEGQELDRFIKRLSFDHELRNRVRHWEERLQPLASAMDPVDPPPQVWRNIVASLTGARDQRGEYRSDQKLLARRNKTMRLQRQLMRWRVATAVACAATFSAFSLLWLQYVMQPVTFDAITVVSSEGEALWVVDASVDSKVLKITAIEPPGISNDQVHELWMVKPDNGGVVSLGLLPKDNRTTITIDRSAIDAAAIALAVSLEPAGGSTENAPTGPVLYQGDFFLLETAGQ